MSRASIAEDETGVAQPALMDLLNRSIIMLCERSRGQPPDIHWCRLWRPGIYHHTERISYPVDFLGLTAWFGLDKYVEHILGLQSGQPTADTADHLNYLLRCSVQGSVDLWDGPKLIQILLKRGADLNVEISNGTTIWGFFLQKLYERYFGRDLDSRDSLDEWGRHIVKAFLGSGANVNEETHCQVARNLDPSVSLPPMVVMSYEIRLRLSARSVLQQVFAKSPNFVEIEDTLITSGASLYLECTQLLFWVSGGGDWRWVDSKLSKQQLNLLTDTCNKCLHANNEPWAQRLEMLDPHLRQLFQELEIEQLYEQARQDEEDQSSTYTDITRYEPSIDAPGSPASEAGGHPHSSHSPKEETWTLGMDSSR